MGFFGSLLGFQFHKGTIKTYITGVIPRAQYGDFNSIKVRLKLRQTYANESILEISIP